MAETSSISSQSATTTPTPSLILSTSIYSYTSIFSASDPSTIQPSSSIILGTSTISSSSYPPTSTSSESSIYTSTTSSIQDVASSTSSSLESTATSTESSISALVASSTASGLQGTSTLTSIPSPLPETTDTGLSRGAKAGISIAIVFFLMLICASILFVLKKRRSRWGLSPNRRGQRGSFVIGHGNDGRYSPSQDSGFEDGIGGKKSADVRSEGGETSMLSGVKGIWHRDGLEKVGRYEDAERGLPLPRMDGDPVRGTGGKAKQRGWS